MEIVMPKLIGALFNFGILKEKLTKTNN